MKDQAATIVLTKDAPSPTGPYVQGLAGAGLVFVSGQLPIRPDGTGLQDMGFDAQVRQALANVFAIVRAGGSAPERILKVTAFIVGAEHQPSFNKIYADAFGNPSSNPVAGAGVRTEQWKPDRNRCHRTEMNDRML